MRSHVTACAALVLGVFVALGSGCTADHINSVESTRGTNAAGPGAVRFDPAAGSNARATPRGPQQRAAGDLSLFASDDLAPQCDKPLVHGTARITYTNMASTCPWMQPAVQIIKAKGEMDHLAMVTICPGDVKLVTNSLPIMRGKRGTAKVRMTGDMVFSLGDAVVQCDAISEVLGAAVDKLATNPKAAVHGSGKEINTSEDPSKSCVTTSDYIVRMQTIQ